MDQHKLSAKAEINRRDVVAVEAMIGLIDALVARGATVEERCTSPYMNRGNVRPGVLKVNGERFDVQIVWTHGPWFGTGAKALLVWEARGTSGRSRHRHPEIKGGGFKYDAIAKKMIEKIDALRSYREGRKRAEEALVESGRIVAEVDEIIGPLHGVYCSSTYVADKVRFQVKLDCTREEALAIAKAVRRAMRGEGGE